MDQVLAVDGSVGILEDLHRTISIIRVIREIRRQRTIETEATAEKWATGKGEHEKQTCLAGERHWGGTQAEALQAHRSGAVALPWVPCGLCTPADPWVPPGQWLECAISETKLLSLVSTFHLAGQSCWSGIPSLVAPLWLLQPRSGWPFPLQGHAVTHGPAVGTWLAHNSGVRACSNLRPWLEKISFMIVSIFWR